MNLVIVESPTKAKTLSGILGKAYTVKASMGHVRDLPKSGLGVDVEKNFEPEYVNTDKGKKTLSDLKAAAEGAETVILATDPDREGEAIAWHLYTVLEGLDKKKKTKKKKTEEVSTVAVNDKYKRVVFHELTKSAIEEAFQHPGVLNMALIDAQQARRVLDRLVGYKLSPLLWKKVRFGLSAGRVQSVAVRLIVERERERTAFKPEEYWSVKVDFLSSDKKKQLTSELVEEDGKKLDITTSDQATKLEKALQDDTYKISSIKKTERQRKPYAPLKTSTLQQMGSNVFGFQAKRTMMAAQKLFENGFITYHRTDSLNLSPQFIDTARAFIKKEFGEKYLPESGITYKTTAKNAQEAHEAIRPTNLDMTPLNLPEAKFTEEERKVYTLVWMRSLECQMLPAVYDQTSINILSGKNYGLRSSGSIVKFSGWLAVGDYLKIDADVEEVSKLADFSEGESLICEKISKQQHFTQPPARYSDATLIKALEELGIGRPSTYAPTISTIQARGYVSKETRYFIPSDFAYVVNDLLMEHFPNIVDYQFTAEMEKELDEIAEGEREWVPVIKEFYVPFEKILAEKDKTLKKVDVTNLGASDEKCPDCGKNLVYKLGKYGKFLSCSGFPDCSYAKPIIDTIAGEENTVQADYGKCPNCETGLMTLKQGRFGKFLGCSNYPKCKTIQKFHEKIGMKCPKCTEGDVVVKKAKRGKFFGCSRYPDCDYSSWKNPMLAEGQLEDKPSQEAVSSIN